jgi:hypothetical protein
MLKRIPKSDISIRPFKSYKEWSFSSGSTEISLLDAEQGNYLSSSVSIDGNLSFLKSSIYGQLRAQFYNGNEDNPFLRFGNKRIEYLTVPGGRDRFLSGSAKVISIPQIYVGEGIKKGSVTLLDGNNTYLDDTYGNLIDATGDYLLITNINLESNDFNFKDFGDNEYNAVLLPVPIMEFDIENQIITINYNGIDYTMVIISFDVETGEMVVDDIPFISDTYVKFKLGNIFYTQGIIVTTRRLDELFTSNWDVSFKSTQTIYEHEYLLIANEDEFNVSQNPTAIIEVGKVTESITGTDGKVYKTTTNPGVKYIKKKSILENGNVLDYRIGSLVNNSVSGGFEHYDLSSSVDSTGSFLSPFITTIGLYDDNCDLVAVAKLPQPIKSEPDIPVNFIVRFDT